MPSWTPPALPTTGPPAPLPPSRRRSACPGWCGGRSEERAPSWRTPCARSCRPTCCWPWPPCSCWAGAPCPTWRRSARAGRIWRRLWRQATPTWASTGVASASRRPASPWRPWRGRSAASWMSWPRARTLPTAMRSRGAGPTCCCPARRESARATSWRPCARAVRARRGSRSGRARSCGRHACCRPIGCTRRSARRSPLGTPSSSWGRPCGLPCSATLTQPLPPRGASLPTWGRPPASAPSRRSWSCGRERAPRASGLARSSHGSPAPAIRPTSWGRRAGAARCGPTPLSGARSRRRSLPCSTTPPGSCTAPPRPPREGSPPRTGTRSPSRRPGRSRRWPRAAGAWARRMPSRARRP